MYIYCNIYTVYSCEDVYMSWLYIVTNFDGNYNIYNLVNYTPYKSKGHNSDYTHYSNTTVCQIKIKKNYYLLLIIYIKLYIYILRNYYHTHPRFHSSIIQHGLQYHTLT